ncbi:MAG: Mu transposase C-terminal domain-containing protein, partial [Desulfuromonadales bacterium]|nr:Mu transposase C-terminal domain-containing protein [Desulfuromonadales bacterium]
LPTTAAARAGAAMGEQIAREAAAAKEARRQAKEAALATFEGLPEARKKEAMAKFELLQACDLFMKSSGIRNIKVGSEKFSKLYAAGKIEVPAWVADFARRSGRLSLSWSSLNRWRKAHKEVGLAGLVNGYKSPSKTTVPEEIQKFVIGLITEFPHIKDKRIREAVEARYHGQPIPHEASLRRFTQKWKEKNASLLLYVSNPDEWRNQHQFAIGDASEGVTELNQVWELDSSPADIMLTDGRHSLVGCIDVYSRRVRLLVCPTSAARHIAALVRRCLIDWGVPINVKTDNGQDYVSHYLMAIFRDLEVDQHLCPPFTPEDKPHIERFFHTFSHSIVELLPGFIGHNVAERKAIESRKSFAERMMTPGETVEIAMTSAELQTLCDRWLKSMYEQAHHSTLKCSPHEKAMSWTQPIRRIADERALDMLLAPVAQGGTRVVGKKGIKNDNTHFSSGHLPDAGTEVRVLEDPADYGTIYVYSLDGEFLCKAEAPERVGIDRKEIAAKASANQKKAMREGAKVLKQLAREAKADTIAMEILEHHERKRANIVDLPQRSVDYTTPALEEAAKARAARDGDLPPIQTPSPEHLAAQIRIEREMAAEQEARESKTRRKVEPIMTPQRAYARWKDIEHRVLNGLPVSEKDQKFFQGFVGTPDWSVMKKMEEDFGPSCYQGY